MSGAWAIAVITDAAAWNYRAHGTAADALDAAKDVLERHAEEGVQEVQVVLEEADS